MNTKTKTVKKPITKGATTAKKVAKAKTTVKAKAANVVAKKKVPVKTVTTNTDIRKVIGTNVVKEQSAYMYKELVDYFYTLNEAMNVREPLTKKAYYDGYIKNIGVTIHKRLFEDKIGEFQKLFYYLPFSKAELFRRIEADVKVNKRY